MFAPDVDLVIAFRVGSASKTPTRREEGRKAEKQYTRLLETLQYAGLKAVGRRGEGRREQDTDGGMGTYDIYFRNDVYDQMGDKKGT